MRKVLIAIGGLGFIIGGCVVLVFTLTAGLPAAADDFFMTAAQGDMQAAYDQTSVGFKEEVTLLQMVDFLDYTGLDGYESASWYNRSFENDIGYLEGTVTTTEGQAIPLFIDLLKEQDTWKIYYMELLHPDGP
ncbi:hypothetical protein HN748_05315 [Candidatus Peregrinibacteria bacterium]|jgi:hypothetical protein|nr:hypothetical protein [Candidatus Peregrinibacteria bacterium]MBT7484679.1 hypothetical protein [Candidatus Peregrinibacteria bacterium]MBT7703628.1 hypothetical protein [Candidatus Peregrinibacteria bacterium]